jgi:hypothetical protein
MLHDIRSVRASGDCVSCFKRTHVPSSIANIEPLPVLDIEGSCHSGKNSDFLQIERTETAHPVRGIQRKIVLDDYSIAVRY